MPVEEADVAESNAADLERQPLLDKPKEEPQKWGWWPFSGGGDGKSPRKNYFGNFFSGSKAKKTEDPIDDEWDSTQYDITRITSWSAFGMVKGCAWDNHSLWRCMGLALLLSVAVALGAFFMPHAVLVKPEKLEKLGTFLNVFVGLLLGFFLASSMNRWYGCVNAFLELLDAVRSMQMQMTALGVAHDKSETLSRYGILSAWLLHLSLNLDSDECQTNGPKGKEDTENSKVSKLWAKLEEHRPQLALPQEKQKLMQHKECYALLWTWVASLIGRMSQDGEIPPMASPTYGRILNIVQEAYGSIRNVRALQMIKAPFIYVHTLAILVHVNNILNAISFGLVLGITFSGVFADDKYEIGKRQRAHLYSSLFMQFCFSMVAPILYLALLDVSVCISQPFTHHDAKIPAMKFIRSLEEDLKNAAQMGDNPPHWEKPYFKSK
eukprot:CAMPEP_0172717896 /NCGR_PEP_ID=MMETSP1074-20121228/72843_1 /TAXON_ID=2916 /ORGANISM="Ceratium fusus, Strain PA161109" /LENGTH=436 /DNA_ID=CAMNT_0013542949 /DNA_START=164 /DNA_END=1474 /DNA_ORIENTATION=+